MSRDTRQQYIVAEVKDPYQRNEFNRPPLEIGQFVQAELNGRQNEGLFIIPRSAVYGERAVMIVDDKNRLQRRTVELLAEEGDSVVIRRGLAEGDKLCISYVPFIANNSVVRLASEKKGIKSKLSGKTDFKGEKNRHSEVPGSVK